MTRATGRAATPEELAIINHPDRRTAWVVVMTATLSAPSPELVTDLGRRLRTIAAEAPIIGARWDGGGWRWDAPGDPVITNADPLRSPSLTGRFRLDREPPLRVAVDSAGRCLTLAAHHAALDGRGMAAVIAALLGQPVPGGGDPAGSPRGGDPAEPEPAVGGSLRDPVRRLLGPADRVAPSAEGGDREVFAAREVALRPPNITGQVAAACAAAAGARNARLGQRWRRVGLTIALGGPPGIGNVAGHHRLDLRAGDPVAPAVRQALHDRGRGPERHAVSRSLRLLAPLADRFSDSLLISNLGRTELPGADQLVLYPVARGRSAVAFAASAVPGARSTLSVRARDLSQRDAEDLLDDAVARLGVRDRRSDRGPGRGATIVRSGESA